MKHANLLERLVNEEKERSNTLGILVFGSVANGTEREDSDLDLMVIYKDHVVNAGVEDRYVDGIKVGKTFFTFETLAESVETVPYLLNVVANSRLLFDRSGDIAPLLEKLRAYFASRPDVLAEWDRIYHRFREEKSRLGYEQTTIIDVFDELEAKYSGGAMKRTFFTQIVVPTGSEECSGNNDNLIARITRAVGQLLASRERVDG